MVQAISALFLIQFSLNFMGRFQKRKTKEFEFDSDSDVSDSFESCEVTR
jgi:hypothetical protein